MWYIQKKERKEKLIPSISDLHLLLPPCSLFSKLHFKKYADKHKTEAQDGDGTWQYYAKSGTLKVKVERTGTNIIQEAAFVFGYGHTTIVISPSLSLPASFGIGFSFGTETMVEKAIRMNSSGVITEY